MPLDERSLVALVLLEEGAEPSKFLIPTMSWLAPGSLLVDRDYEGRQSEPECEIIWSHLSMSAAVRSSSIGKQSPLMMRGSSCGY